MKGRNTYGIVVLFKCKKSLYCNIKCICIKGRNTYGIVILKNWYCLNVYERQKYIWYCIVGIV